MTTDWQLTKAVSPKGENTTFTAECAASADGGQQQAVNSLIDKLVEVLPLAIDDNSMYVIFEWDQSQRALKALVSDSSKQRDSLISLQCHFPAMEDANEQDKFELIRFWIRDYLTTCNEFMRYSLIAILHTGNSKQSVLL